MPCRLRSNALNARSFTEQGSSPHDRRPLYAGQRIRARTRHAQSPCAGISGEPTRESEPDHDSAEAQRRAAPGSPVPCLPSAADQESSGGCGENTHGSTIYVCARSGDCSVGVNLAKVETWVVV